MRLHTNLCTLQTQLIAHRVPEYFDIIFAFYTMNYTIVYSYINTLNQHASHWECV